MDTRDTGLKSKDRNEYRNDHHPVFRRARHHRLAVAITRLVRTVRRFKIGQAVAETEAKPTEPFSFQLDHATDWPGS